MGIKIQVQVLLEPLGRVGPGSLIVQFALYTAPRLMRWLRWCLGTTRSSIQRLALPVVVTIANGRACVAALGWRTRSTTNVCVKRLRKRVIVVRLVEISTKPPRLYHEAVA